MSHYFGRTYKPGTEPDRKSEPEYIDDDPCPECDGRGFYTEKNEFGGLDDINCEYCEGTGYIDSQKLAADRQDEMDAKYESERDRIAEDKAMQDDEKER